jgi:4-amino-4-deoxy-L-arabinose transferase-like glycosyltransferase
MKKQSKRAVKTAAVEAPRPIAPAAESATRPWLVIVSLAVVMTVLNALKPMHMDDTAYYQIARQIAGHPLDPYGFRMLWYQHPEPANQILAPPVVPYWLAIAIRLFGEQPVAWKLWQFPFALILVLSTFRLLERFGAASPGWLTAMVALSPALLPGFNLMLDVPALALGLASVVVFLRACDRRSIVGALDAGLVAGLAMQTKYTAIVAPFAILLYGWLQGQRKLGTVAILVSIALFSSWELFTAMRYGESHLLCNIRQKHTISISPVDLIWPLIVMLGALAPVGVLLNLVGLNLSERRLMVCAALAAGMYVAIARLGSLGGFFTAEQVYAISGVLFLGSMVTVLVVLAGQRWLKRPDRAFGKLTFFLVGWLVLELLAYFALSPFPAARRLMGIMVVATILAGRLIQARGSSARRWLPVIALGQAILCAVYVLTDCRGADAQRSVAAAARQRLGSSAEIWFTGHWGFEFYAERAGMHPVVPLVDGPDASIDTPSSIRAGDYLLIPDGHIYQQNVAVSRDELDSIGTFQVDDRWPFMTVINYYMGGFGRTPLDPRHGRRLVATLWRARRDFTPQEVGRTAR